MTDMQMFDNGVEGRDFATITFTQGDRFKSEGHTYVVEFDDDIVKVGHGVDPKTRLREHASQAALRNVRATRWWVSAPDASSYTSERELIAWCSEHGTLVRGREWFRGVQFADTVHFANSLPTKQRPLDPSSAARAEGLMRLAMGRAYGDLPTTEQVRILAESLNAPDEDWAALLQHKVREEWRTRTRSAVAARSDERTFLEVMGFPTSTPISSAALRRPRRRLSRRL